MSDNAEHIALEAEAAAVVKQQLDATVIDLPVGTAWSIIVKEDDPENAGYYALIIYDEDSHIGDPKDPKWTASLHVEGLVFDTFDSVSDVTLTEAIATVQSWRAKRGPR
jgi:hypothetical protein